MKTVAEKNKDMCCGCGACQAICPVMAIQLQLDVNGFYYPRVEVKRCIICSKCVQICTFFPETRESRKVDGN